MSLNWIPKYHSLIPHWLQSLSFVYPIYFCLNRLNCHKRRKHSRRHTQTHTQIPTHKHFTSIYLSRFKRALQNFFFYKIQLGSPQNVWFDFPFFHTICQIPLTSHHALPFARTHIQQKHRIPSTTIRKEITFTQKQYQQVAPKSSRFNSKREKKKKSITVWDYQNSARPHSVDVRSQLFVLRWVLMRGSKI